MPPVSSSIRALPILGTPISGARRVEYLRFSITDRCNERCLYCLPEENQVWIPRNEILLDTEILAIVRAAVRKGFKHFRITGGEPLLRPGLVALVKAMKDIPGVLSLQMTTNGTRLAPIAKDLQRAGLDRVNISLDALNADTYHSITKGNITSVLEGIDSALTAGFTNVKLNAVLMKGKNDQEIIPLIHFAAERSLVLRFIELMPVSLTEMLSEANFLSITETKAIIADIDKLIPIQGDLGLGPAKYFQLERLGSTVGFIGALTDLHFCEQCNKIRVTADGKLRPCLGHHGEFDLMPSLRPHIDDTYLDQMFSQALSEKPPQHLFRDNYQPGRIMTAIGG